MLWLLMESCTLRAIWKCLNVKSGEITGGGKIERQALRATHHLDSQLHAWPLGRPSDSHITHLFTFLITVSDSNCCGFERSSSTTRFSTLELASQNKSVLPKGTYQLLHQLRTKEKFELQVGSNFVWSRSRKTIEYELYKCTGINSLHMKSPDAWFALPLNHNSFYTSVKNQIIIGPEQKWEAA